jgi:hypothetical protein
VHESRRQETFEKFLNYLWLRPENALTTTLRAERLSRCFPSPGAGTLDVSCGDGAFAFLTLGGEFHPDTDMFAALDLEVDRSAGGDFLTPYLNL